MENKSFIFYKNWYDGIKRIPQELRERAYDIIARYALFGEEPEETENWALLALFYSSVKQGVDDNAARKAKITERRQEAANARWRNAKNANASNSMQMHNLQCINDNVNVNVNVNELSNDNIEKEIALTCKEKAQAEKPKKKSSEWKKPTVEEIRAYAEEKGYTNVDAEDFWNFYESKGWMVGSNHMTKWRASVALWNRSMHRQPRNRDPMRDRMHFQGEHDPHAYDEDEKIAQRQKENGL